MMTTRACSRRPTDGAVLVIRGTVLALLLAALSRTWADPDLWGHVRFGGDILHHWLSPQDPYSFTADVPWVNHEWLAEVVMYLAYAAAGSPGLVLLKMVVVCLTLWMVARITHAGEIDVTAADVLLSAALLGLWARVYVVRPQLFSVLLFAILLWILASVRRGATGRLWLLPGVFVLWVNAHGGWTIGVGTLALWTVLSVSGVVTGATRRSAIVVAMLVLAATLVNPYGAGLWTFLYRTVGLGRANINDWRPLIESGSQVLIPWSISAVIAIIAVARNWRRLPLFNLAVTAGLALASVRVSRLDVFFTLSTVMLLGPYLSDEPTRAGARASWTRGTIAVAAIVLVLGSAIGWRMRHELSCVRLDGPWMPERESAAFISANHLEGRLLSWFDWGQLAIWHFGPGLRVSMDGRRETVYSEAFVAEHLRLYYQPAEAPALLEKVSPDYAWLPSAIPLTAALDAAGWLRIYSGPVSVVFSRRPIDTVLTTAPTAPACFPGP